MKALYLTTALTLCLSIASNAALADKLIANGDTGVDVQAIQQKLGIDPEAKSKIIMVNTNDMPPAEADGGHILQQPKAHENHDDMKTGEKETINFETHDVKPAKEEGTTDSLSAPKIPAQDEKYTKEGDVLANSPLLNTEIRAAKDAGIKVQHGHLNQ